MSCKFCFLCHLFHFFLLNFGSFEIPKRAIINGKATSYKPFYIGVTTDQLQGSVCGGTFISTKYDLTAAHCLIKGGYRSTGVKVVFQKYHKPHHYGSGKKYNVKQFWTHSDYTEKGYEVLPLFRPGSSYKFHAWQYESRHYDA